jgi:CheY-like chemotaxis protein
VRVSLAADGAIARVRVADSGPGIPAEFRDKIFGKFQQADGSDARKKNGTGLGLAIARAIVELHNGTVSFESEIGRGATFVVELPCTPANFRSRPTPIGGLRLVGGPRVKQRPQIVFVEQDEGVIHVLRARCEAMGDISCARSGDEALDIVHSTVVDAVIADPALPGVGGMEFVQRLKAATDEEGTTLLIYSSREYSATELETMHIPRTHAFVKSRDDDRELVMRLRAVLTVRQESPQLRKLPLR